MINYILLSYLIFYLILLLTDSTSWKDIKLGLFAPIILPILIFMILDLIIKLLRFDNIDELNKILKDIEKNDRKNKNN